MPVIAEIVDAQASVGGLRVTCRFTGSLHEPLAPAGLYREPGSNQAAVELHRVCMREGDLVTFETLGAHHRSASLVGSIFHYRAWWLPAAMQAVLDQDEVWQYRTYPDDGDHHHCLFSWETIAAYAKTRDGYWSRKYGWITIKSYQDFIRDDSISSARSSSLWGQPRPSEQRRRSCLLPIHGLSKLAAKSPRAPL